MSAILEDVPPEEVDGQIENGLRRIVEFLGLDRSGFGEFFDGEFRVTHTYAVPGIEPSPKIILAKIVPWLAAKISRGEISAIEDPAQLPEEAKEEKAYPQEKGIKSNLMIPFSVAGTMLCVIAFASFRSYRSWPEPLVKQLKPWVRFSRTPSTGSALNKRSRINWNLKNLSPNFRRDS